MLLGMLHPLVAYYKEFISGHGFAQNQLVIWKHSTTGFPGGLAGKDSSCNAGDMGSVPGSRREWQPPPVFLPGESYGQRSLEGYSPCGRKELNTTEVTQHTY